MSDERMTDRISIEIEVLINLLERIDHKKTWGFSDGELMSLERKEFVDEKGDKYQIDEWLDINGEVVELKAHKGGHYE